MVRWRICVASRLTGCSETLYAAFRPGWGSQKSALYQWSLPEGDMRHVPETASSSCMADACGRQFGLLGEWLLSELQLPVYTDGV
jgi:hypothetical protein